MDNFIEESIDYLYHNGGFDLLTGHQRFEFRIRPNSEIEVRSINNHIISTFQGEPDIYQFFAFLIFCDMFSSHQKSTISLCKDKNVSRNNLKALNRVYNIYKVMLSMKGKLLAEALSDDDPGALDYIMLESSYDEIKENTSNLKYQLIKNRIDSYAYDFARRFEYFDNLYQELITTEEYDPLNEYARIKWEELENDIEANHPSFFSKKEALEILFSRTNKLEYDLGLEIDGEEKEKYRILNILIDLYDEIDIMDLIYFVKCAFSSAAMEDRNIVYLDDFMEAIELSYLDDEKKNEILNRLDNKKSKTKESNEKIIVFSLFK